LSTARGRNFGLVFIIVCFGILFGGFVFRFILGVYLACVCAVLVSAAQSDSLTISDAVELALERHPAVAVYRAETVAAQAMVQQADLRPHPDVSMGAGYKDTDTDSGYVLDVAMAFPVERTGKRETRLEIAESGIRIAEKDVQQFQRDIELQVRTLSYEYLTASADAAIAGDIAERSRAMIDLLNQRPAAGPVILLELRVIEGSLVEFQKSARDFEVQRDAARASLNILLGYDDNDPLVLIDELTPPSKQYSMATLTDGLEESPAVMKRLAEIERAVLVARAAALEAKPDWEIGPFLSREDADGEEMTIGLAVSVPLTRRNRQQGSIAAAKAQQARAEAELVVEKLNARNELARRLRLYDSAVAQVEAIPVSQIERLHAAADLADRQYRLGAIPVQLFLDIQREFLNVQLLRHNALLESLKLSAELEWLTGATSRKDMQ